jgi:exopolyphosphatase/guanosine-5'-triphosphate,3'-diphosphate pyrophosphatase
MARVAAIDCGTNSIRLLIADVTNQGMREVVRQMEVVRLGEEVDTTGRFKVEAVERTLKVVGQYSDEMRRRGVERVRFCATSATRDASNREIFISGVEQLLGITPEVIPGVEEAALSFLGATSEMAHSDGPFLVVDIGGGSTEFVYGTDSVEKAMSVDIGCVRMHERHLHSNPVAKSELAAAIEDIDDAIARAAREVPITEAKTLIAVAGTATTVAAAALALDSYDRYAIHLARIPAQEVHRIAIQFQNSSTEQIAALPFMHPGRVDVITAGALVLSRIMLATRADFFVASESDILDGIAINLGRAVK